MLYWEHLESRTAEGDVGTSYAAWLRDCRPGVWARPHARAMKRVRDFAKVVVAGKDPDEVAAFVAGFGAESASSRGDRGVSSSSQRLVTSVSQWTAVGLGERTMDRSRSPGQSEWRRRRSPGGSSPRHRSSALALMCRSKLK